MVEAGEADRSLSRANADHQSASSVRPTNAFVRFERREIEQSIPDRFEQIARRVPDKIAVRTAHGTLTYAQLNAVANRIAHLILARCSSGSEPVALLFEQGALLIAAILGSLKAGKIYVPLDPLAPGARTIEILADSTSSIILTHSVHLDRAHELAALNLRVLRLDTLMEGHSTQNPSLVLDPDRLAYIFYTSGSTGKPKGLADTHRNVLHNIMRYTNSLHICAEDRLTLLQSASFSGSVSSLFCALLNGATSFPFSLQQEGADRLASWVSQEGITIYHSVPSIFRLLATGRHSYSAVRVIRLEGDQATPKDIEFYQKHFPDTCLLVNGLGATECGIVRQYFVNKQTPIPDSVVPIGFAVEDMEVVLLDDFGQPIGPDSVGEIAVRSRYLAPGYWRRPELTRAAFLDDPQGGRDRTYRTGDVGRMRAGGCLEYLGRKDSQLRIRGRWVEIAEVEKALRSLNVFKDVVVVALADKSLEPRLVAYVVPTASSPPKIDEIRRSLAGRLPMHMIPSALVILDAIPLNAYGKTDRRALPPPDQARPALERTFVPPRTPIECVLAGIWCELLGLERVGIHDDFFAVGGDSLSAMHVVTRVVQEFRVQMSLQAIFESPTIAAMAAVITAHAGTQLDA